MSLEWSGNPKMNFALVQGLIRQVHTGGQALLDLPETLVVVIRRGAWREFTTEGGATYQHERFVDFVTAKPLAGLGADVPMLDRVCTEHPEALLALRSAVVDSPGGDRRSEEVRAVDIKNNNIIFDDALCALASAPKPVQGTSRAYTLSRLEREAQNNSAVAALFEQVKAGQISANRAAQEAGWRSPTFTAPQDIPGLARALKRRYTATELQQLVDLLTEAA
jgi:hypothetical protein